MARLVPSDPCSPSAGRAALSSSLASLTVASAGRLPIPEERPYDVAVVPQPRPRGASPSATRRSPRTSTTCGRSSTSASRGASERGWDRLYPARRPRHRSRPGHGYAYQVAGTILRELRTGSRSRTRSSRRGCGTSPSRYILPFLRAFNAFYYEGDYAEAGRFVEIAARLPGAPAHLRQNVLATYVKGKRADAALEFLEHARDAAQDDESRGGDRRAARDGRGSSATPPCSTTRSRAGARGYGLPPLIAVLRSCARGWSTRIPADPVGGEYDRRGGRARRVHRADAADRARATPRGARQRTRLRPRAATGRSTDEDRRRRARHVPRDAPPQGPGEPARLRLVPDRRELRHLRG